MPQMFPLNWFLLFLFFFIMLILSIVLTFFYSISFPYMKNTTNTSIPTTLWMW